MSLNPFRKDIPLSLGDLQAEMNHMFDRVWHGGLSTRPFDGKAWAPALDVLDEDDRVVVVAEVPGLEVSDVEVSFQDGRLTLKGNRASPWTEELAGRVVRSERRYGLFSRSIDLPAEIDEDAITAAVHHGVITVTLPKVEPAQGKQIKIDVTD